MPADYTQYPYIEKRLRYFDGQFLKDQDFIDNQKYYIDRQRRQRFLVVAGILDGLTVESGNAENPDAPFQAQVTPGTALDNQGRQVVLANRTALPLSNFGGQTVTVVIRYQELPSDLAPEGSDAHQRWHELPQFSILADNETLPEDGIPLAQLSLDQDGLVTVDPTLRNYAGLRLPGSNNNTLKADAFGGTTFSGTLSITGILQITESATCDSLTVSGNAGIGISNPQQKLEVDGTIAGTHLALSRGDDQRGALFLSEAGDFNHALYNNLSNIDGEGVSNRVKLNVAEGLSIRVGTDETKTTALKIVRTGQMGLNTSDLGTYKLSIQQTESSSAQGIRLINADETRSLQCWVGTGEAVLDAEGSTHLHLRTAGQDRLFIANNGNISLGGARPPSSRLTIQTPGDYDGESFRWESQREPDRYNLSVNSRVTSGNVRWRFNQRNNNRTISNVLAFNNGNVGIRTDEPRAALDVHGRIMRQGQDFSRAGTANHNGVVTVPWGTTADWNIFVSPRVSGFNEGSSNNDNALLMLECWANARNSTSWTIHIRHLHRNSTSNDGSWFGGTANYILIPK